MLSTVEKPLWYSVEAGVSPAKREAADTAATTEILLRQPFQQSQMASSNWPWQRDIQRPRSRGVECPFRFGLTSVYARSALLVLTGR
jgi:hypothetical protein